MGALVRRFHMHAAEIRAVFERLNHRVHLALIVGIQLCVGAFNPRGIHAAKARNAPNQRHGGNRAARLAVKAFKRGKAHRAARPPRPDAVGRQLARSHTALIDRMIAQNLVGDAHERSQLPAHHARRPRMLCGSVKRMPLRLGSCAASMTPVWRKVGVT